MGIKNHLDNEKGDGHHRGKDTVRLGKREAKQGRSTRKGTFQLREPGRGIMWSVEGGKKSENDNRIQYLNHD